MKFNLNISDIEAGKLVVEVLIDMIETVEPWKKDNHVKESINNFVGVIKFFTTEEEFIILKEQRFPWLNLEETLKEDITMIKLLKERVENLEKENKNLLRVIKVRRW